MRLLLNILRRLSLPVIGAALGALLVGILLSIATRPTPKSSPTRTVSAEPQNDHARKTDAPPTPRSDDAHAPPHETPHPADPVDDVPLVHKARDPATSVIPPAELAAADAFLLQGDFDSAHVKYAAMSRTANGPISSELRYRRALAAEGLQHWDRAVAEYRHVAAEAVPGPLRSAAILGEGRVWLRVGRPQRAQQVLAELLVQIASSWTDDSPLRPELLYLFSLALSDEVLPKESPGPLHESALATAPLPLLTESALNVLRQPAHHAKAFSQAPGLKLHGSDRDLSRRLISGVIDHTSMPQLLEQLAGAASVRLTMSDPARNELAHRHAELALTPLPLATLMAALVEPLGIVWQFEANELHLTANAETAPDSLAPQRTAVAETSLHHAATTYVDHPYCGAAQLGLAALAWTRADAKAATQWYELARKQNGRSGVAIAAAYNLGVSFRVQGDREQAKQAFYVVVDTDPRNRLAALAYLQTGRMALADADPATAVSPLSRAVMTAVTGETEACAALNLAAAYLLRDNPGAAARVLEEHSAALMSDPFRAAATFLSADSRYLTAADPITQAREARTLLESLWVNRGDTLLGSSGDLLMGRAYRQLGLSWQMAEVYERALNERTDSPLAAEMLFALAEFWHSVGKSDAAQRQWTRLADTPDGHWPYLAHLRLAETAWELRDFDECVRQCATVLRRPLANRSDVLRLMGRALEQKGQLQQAALCFAGQVPKDL